MTQYDFGALSPADSGPTLAAKLSGVIPALLTHHKGPTRPSYTQPGMLWINDAGATWLLNLFDGDEDVTIAGINPATHQLQTTGVPATRKVKTGAAFLLNGVAGTDAAPAEADLSADLLIKLIFASTAATIEGAREDLPVHPAGMKAAMDHALAGFSTGGIKGVQVFTTSRTYTPTSGATKALVIATGGGASGGVGNGSSQGGLGGGGAGTCISLVDAEVTAVTIGAGGAARSGANLAPNNGGHTTFGAITAYGGSSYNGNTGTGGQLIVGGGQGGFPDAQSPYYGGDGGGSFWGAGGPGGRGSSGQGALTAYGAGGGGGAGTANSGAGAPGVVLVLEF